MNSVDMESIDSSESEDNEDYIPDQEEHDEESKVEDDDTGQIYDDDNDDNELMGNTGIDVNEDNNVGPPTGTPGEGMADENPGVEDNEIKGEEEDDRIPSTTPGEEPPRDARDSGSARSHSTHLETSSSDRP